jgi:lipopolysaccharide/colanic/teichoic acid biosynthesis glycosyltransferase
MTIYNITKRVADIIATLICIFFAVPLMIVIALISIAVQGFPVFYTSMRHVTKDKAVRIYKFRSMVTDATDEKYKLNERYMKDGYLDIPIDCEVYTPFGRILERTQIVELPQILNVLINGMSWVGNRALPEENVRLLSFFPGWEERFESPCGLTGISQVVGKYHITPKQRIAIECLYSRVYKQGNVVKADLLIVLATIKLILVDANLSYDDAVALLESCLQ